MGLLKHHTKIVATIGPASSSPEVVRQMVKAGMGVARLNFSHGNYDDHAQRIAMLRDISEELDTPIALLQDLQGPKIRVGNLPNGGIDLHDDASLTLVPLDQATEPPHSVGIDYPDLAAEATPNTTILLDDGLLELAVTGVDGAAVQCRVVRGGRLKSRKGVNLPSLNLNLPSMTDKDKQDLEFGLSQGIDVVSLSFVRQAADLETLKAFLAERKAPDVPVIAKIEKPQAIANLKAILDVCDGVMVARGDLGVEMRPEKVPLLQKDIIRACNQRGIPVITATQMLESMIQNPRPTRAEASDVANAIIDGTDAVMLSGESAVGAFPVRAVEMLARIAGDVEPGTTFTNHPPAANDKTHALSEALNAIDKILPLRCIATFTSSGYTTYLAAGERPQVPIAAFTANPQLYHRLNLVWGVRPILVDRPIDTFEEMTAQVEATLLARGWADPGDLVLIMGGIPAHQSRGTNFLKIHTLGDR